MMRERERDTEGKEGVGKDRNFAENKGQRPGCSGAELQVTEACEQDGTRTGAEAVCFKQLQGEASFWGSIP